MEIKQKKSIKNLFVKLTVFKFLKYKSSFHSNFKNPLILKSLTITSHSACEAFLKSAILTAITVMFCDFTVHGTAALIAELLAD
jgi:hypothetical protein